MSRNSSVLAYGDVHTDARAVVAARELSKRGFAALHYQEVEDARAAVGLEPRYYARHPAGGVINLAALRNLGWTYESARIPPLLASTIGLWFFFLAIRRAVGARTAFWALILLATQSPVYLTADAYQMFSWGLFVKSVGFYTIVRASHERGSIRYIAVMSAALNSLVAVLFFSIDTLSSVGLFAVLYPMLAVRGVARERFGLAAVTALSVGAAMAIGWVLRLSLAAPIYGSLGDAIRNVFEVARFRSVGESADLPAGRSYWGEILHRHLVYTPLPIIVVVFSVIVVAIRARLKFKTWPTAKGVVPLVVATLIADAAYYGMMRQHVSYHVHTTLNLCHAAAVLAGAAFDMAVSTWPGRTGNLGRLAILMCGFAASIAFVRDHSYGNLSTPWAISRARRLADEIAEMADRLPDDAVVVLPSRHLSWPTRAAAARLDIDMIDGCTFRTTVETEVPSLVARLTPRPTFALTSSDDDDPVRAAVAKDATIVWQVPRFTLFRIR